MKSDLAGRTALVTGAQQGIGRATALALAKAGASVAVNWLDDELAAERVCAEVRAAGGVAHPVRGSVGSTPEVARIVAEAHAGLGGIDILVNNAGVFPRSPFLELAESEWDQVLGVNLKGSFLVAQAVARRMVSEGRKGAIVNLSSSSVRGHALGVHYAASKAGVIGMTRSMALALAPHGIRVNAIAPGLTDTAQPRYQFSETEMAEQSRLIPLGAMAKPADIADIIVFLASEKARFITGEVVHANGGLYMA
ncbi:MAG: SDR family oxidoreductase [Hyphomicrobiaceae bacterium]|nr:SDR family oxidoreductase [Hyphomicrobiaceae bacterium]